MAGQQPYQLTARTLALSDVIPTQAADGATEVGKNTIQDVADLVTAGQVITVKVSLSSAEILALFTTPKELIAAPGAGKFIQPIAVVYNFTYGTTTYTTNVSLNIGYDPVANGSITNTTILGAGQSRLARALFSSANTFVLSSFDPVNKGFYAHVHAGDPLSGDGTLDIIITYCIISI